MTPGQLGRAVARVELGFAAGTGFVVAPLLYVAAPRAFEPPMFYNPGLQGPALVGIAIAGILIGFFWMLRIYRANPEPDQRAWRYRHRN